jgi:hypothetical protein
MAKHMKSYSTSVTIREMQISPQDTTEHLSISVAKIKTGTISDADKDAGYVEILHCCL